MVQLDQSSPEDCLRTTLRLQLTDCFPALLVFFISALFLAGAVRNWSPQANFIVEITATGNKLSSQTKGAVAWLRSPTFLALRSAAFTVRASNGWERNRNLLISVKRQPAEMEIRGDFDAKTIFKFVKSPYSGEVQVEINGIEKTINLYSSESGVATIALEPFFKSAQLNFKRTRNHYLLSITKYFLVLLAGWFAVASSELPEAQAAPAAIPLCHVLGIFVLYFIFFCGLWPELSHAGPVLFFPFLATGLLLSFLPGRFQESLNIPSFKNALSLLRFTPKKALLVIMICLPVMLYLAFTWNQEFPFSGDHDFQLAQAISFANFWKTALWLMAPHVVAGIWLFRSRFRSLWIFSGYLLLFACSFFVQSTNARYPGLDYFFTAAWIFLANAFHWIAPLNSLRVNHSLSILIWIAVLRPVFLKRQPDLPAMLIAALFFYQKDVVYYFTSSYLEPWAVIFSLLSIESLLLDENRKQALIWIGIAAIVKEQAIILLPFVFFALFASKGERKNAISLTLTAFAAAVPFLFYMVTRSHQQIFRNAEILTFNELVARPHLLELSKRVGFQWQVPGLIALVTAMTLLALGIVTSSRTPFRDCMITAGGFAIMLLFFADRGSIYWTGYPRFQLITYAVLFALLTSFVSQLNRTASISLLVVLFLLNSIPLLNSLRDALRPSPYRNFIEHYEAPVFFSIRNTVQGMERANQMRNVDTVLIVDHTNPPYIRGLNAAYPDLSKRYRIDSTTAEPFCECHNEDHAVLVPALFYSGLNSNSREQKKEQDWMIACEKQLQRSCKMTYRNVYQENILALGGTGIKQ